MRRNRKRFILTFSISFILAGVFLVIAHMAGWGWVLNSPKPRSGYFRNGGSDEIFACCSGELAVRVIEAGKPKKGELITYDITGPIDSRGSFDEKDGGITSKNVATNSKGYAEVEYWAGAEPGNVRITASGMSSSLSPSSGYIDITVKDNDPTCPATWTVQEIFDDAALGAIQCDGEDGFASLIDVNNVEFNVVDFADALKANGDIGSDPAPAEIDAVVNAWVSCIEEHEESHIFYFEQKASEGKNQCKGCACKMSPSYLGTDCELNEETARHIEAGCLYDISSIDPASASWVILQAIIEAIKKTIIDKDFPNC